jgi:hypothetical protein
LGGLIPLYARPVLRRRRRDLGRREFSVSTTVRGDVSLAMKSEKVFRAFITIFLFILLQISTLISFEQVKFIEVIAKQKPVKVVLVRLFARSIHGWGGC